MKQSKWQLHLPHPGIHAVVLMNSQSGRQGEEHIRNTEYICISCCPVHQRSLTPFVIKGINILLPVSNLETRKTKNLLSITSVIYCEFPKNADSQGLIRARSDS